MPPGIALLVREHDGRLAPLEPDRISRTLFSATEALGRPDAFLARELADHIAASLAAEFDEPPTLDELQDQVTKYVRELGHPALALRYQQGTAFHASDDIEPEPFPRDVVSLARDGLLLLTGDKPLQLAGLVLSAGLDPSRPDLGLSAAIGQAHRHTGGWLALDGPEHALAALDGNVEALTARCLDALRRSLETSGLRGLVHLNIPTAPAWASHPDVGPLFASFAGRPPAERIRAVADALLDGLTADGAADPRLIPCWHLTPTELNADATPRLLERVTRSFGGPVVEFVIDRARQPAALGPGLSRTSPAALLFVGIHLARLVEQVTPAEPERFLAKLVSLARLARSAGHAKLDFLRRHGPPEVRDRFLLDRARLVVVPVGLDEAVRRLVEGPLCDQGKGTALGRQVIEELRRSLTSEPPYDLVAVIDGVPFGFGFGPALPARLDAAGLTPWDSEAPPRQQLRCAGTLHAVARAGVAAITFPRSDPPAVEDLVGTLRLAGHYEVQRLRFVGI
jgi:hypothetical protein